MRWRGEEWKAKGKEATEGVTMGCEENESEKEKEGKESSGNKRKEKNAR